ncbi:MAG: sigma-54-dependent Fis family transcriptional regulator [Kofleriaceae bacterium]
MTDRLVLEDVSATAWSDFHAGRTVDLGVDLATCWSRSRSLGAPQDVPVDDQLLRGEALRLHAGHLELIEAIGDSILDRATSQVADRDFLLLLADRDGVVVRTSGGGEFAETASRVRLIAGANWSESARGTNAIGTAAAANRPTEVHGRAHFGRSYGELVCYAAPIRGVDGQPIAVLDATSRMDRASADIGAVIVRAARSLEELLRLQAYASAGLSMTRVLGRSLDRMREPALWLEAPGVIARANPAARELFGAGMIGRDPLQVFGMNWGMVLAESLSPTDGGLPIQLRDGGGVLRINGESIVRMRSFRLRLEPIAAPNGMIVAVMAVFESPALPKPRPSQPIVVARRADDPFAPIFAEDAGVLAAIEWSRKLAASDVPVMLLAETGSGKELFANAIHAASPRAHGPFHAINCGALAPSLLETELFGYAPGAFTGAERTGRSGLFRAASGGTLFLDEVAEMPPAMQAALLRVLETQTYRRVGDTRLERTDVRVICATCRDLPALVEAGTFRQDLYYRLKGAIVKIAPLRERMDVSGLAAYLAEQPISDEAAAAIARFAWPGNVRELKSVLAVARVVAGGGVIELDHLPAEVIAEPVIQTGIAEVEREALVRALAAAGGNVSEAARALGVARSTVHRMKKRFGLP